MAWFGRNASGRGDWRVAVGAGLLTLSALLAFRQLGIWWSDAIAWPLALAAFGVALLWVRSARRAALPADPQAAEAAPPRPSPEERPRRVGSKLAEEYSGAFGVLLVVGAALLFLTSNHVLGGVRDAALTAVVVIVALGLILAPFLWRLGRNLAAERAERIRSEERAQVAAHLHDSVLQTLTLMQKRADDPREVAALARRQERELRDWLAGGGPSENGGRSLASELRSAAEAVEDDHRVAIESVVVGRLRARPARRGGTRGGARGAPQRGQALARFRSDPASTPRSTMPGSRCSFATAAPASIPAPSRRTAAASGSRSSGAWSGPEDAPTSAPAPGAAPRLRSRSPARAPRRRTMHEHATPHRGAGGRPRAVPRRGARRARGPRGRPRRGGQRRGGGARHLARAARRRPARRPHAGRRRGRGDPPRGAGAAQPSASWPCPSPTQPRTSSP